MSWCFNRADYSLPFHGCTEDGRAEYNRMLREQMGIESPSLVARRYAREDAMCSSIGILCRRCHWGMTLNERVRVYGDWARHGGHRNAHEIRAALERDLWSMAC